MLMRLKELRQNAGMTQQEVAADMGVAQNTISNWETERYFPYVRQLPQLARIFGCKIDELFLPSQ